MVTCVNELIWKEIIPQQDINLLHMRYCSRISCGGDNSGYWSA